MRTVHPESCCWVCSTKRRQSTALTYTYFCKILLWCVTFRLELVVNIFVYLLFLDVTSLFKSFIKFVEFTFVWWLFLATWNMRFFYTRRGKVLIIEAGTVIGIIIVVGLFYNNLRGATCVLWFRILVAISVIKVILDVFFFNWSVIIIAPASPTKTCCTNLLVLLLSFE